MSDVLLTGSCLCGAVRYELTDAPYWAHACHCSRCRKITGSPFAANAFVPLESLRYVAGKAHLNSYRIPKADRFTHTFCKLCGSTLPSPNPSKSRVVIPMGSLDDDPGLLLKAHIWVDSKADWDAIVDDLPQHTEAHDF